MSLKLYEVTQSLVPLLESGFDEETGEMTPELATALAVFENKGAAVAAYALNLEAEAEATKAALARITQRKRTLEAQAMRLREYLRSNMAQAGISRIDAIDNSFSVKLERERDESVEIDDNAVLPDSFCRIKLEPDKTKLKAALKSGQPVPAGVHLVRRDRLTIR